MNKILKLLAAFIAVTGITFADTALTESLSVSGFVDMSYTDGDNGKESTSGIDQVEVDFTFNNGGPVTGQLDIEYVNKDANLSLNVEEAYINYALAESGIVTVGRFETMLLQDASEPTGLYQYSNAYDFYGSNLNQKLYDLGDQGIKFSNGGWAISLVDNGDGKIGDGNTTATDGNGDYAYEVSYSGKLSDTVTGFIGGRFTEYNNSNNDSDILNLHLTHEEGPWVVGGEYVTSDYNTSTDNTEQMNNILMQSNVNVIGVGGLNNAPTTFTTPSTIQGEADIVNDTTFTSVDVNLFSLFANYSYSEINSVTVRYSNISGDAVANNNVRYDVDADKFTLAHNSALSDDLALVLEYSMEESDHQTLDQDTFAVELLYAF
ncbi:MAG: Uncharacterised protein [Puniceicoccaceae bacterium MED-G32]|nr:MAG: Uncharacterised protein [Puniceicoccaceae bacterium MED-G32]